MLLSEKLISQTIYTRGGQERKQQNVLTIMEAVLFMYFCKLKYTHAYLHFARNDLETV